MDHKQFTDMSKVEQLIFIHTYVFINKFLQFEQHHHAK